MSTISICTMDTIDLAALTHVTGGKGQLQAKPHTQTKTKAFDWGELGQSARKGAVIGGTTGIVGGAITGAFSGAAVGGVGAIPGAVGGAAVGGLAGLVSGGVGGAMDDAGKQLGWWN